MDNVYRWKITIYRCCCKDGKISQIGQISDKAKNQLMLRSNSFTRLHRYSNLENRDQLT